MAIDCVIKVPRVGPMPIARRSEDQYCGLREGLSLPRRQFNTPKCLDTPVPTTVVLFCGLPSRKGSAKG